MTFIRTTKGIVLSIFLTSLLLTSIYLYACPKVKSVTFDKQIVALGGTTKMIIELVSPLAQGECPSDGTFKFTSTTNGKSGTYSGDKVQNNHVISVDKTGTFTFTVYAYGKCKSGSLLGDASAAGTGTLIVPIVKSIDSDKKLVAKSKPITFTATSSEGSNWPLNQPVWKSNNGGTFDPPTGPVTKWTSDKASTTEEDFEITAKCGSVDVGKSIKVTVVELKKVTYFDPQNKELDIPSPFYVASKSNVKFKAYPSPGNKWPKDEPIWGGAANGNNPENTVKFDISANNQGNEEEKEIFASCGNKLSYKILVCPVPSVTLTPGEDHPVTAKVKIVDRDVNGNTEAEITKSLGNPPFGKTNTVDQSAEYTLKLNNVITGYNVIKFEGLVSYTEWPSLDIDVTMPKWVNEGTSTNKTLVKKWQNFYNKLKTHEDGHVKLNEKYASQTAKLLNKGKFNGFAKNNDEALELMKTKADSEVDTIFAAHQKAQTDYDTTTNNGATQGAVWPQPN